MRTLRILVLLLFVVMSVNRSALATDKVSNRAIPSVTITKWYSGDVQFEIVVTPAVEVDSLRINLADAQTSTVEEITRTGGFERFCDDLLSASEKLKMVSTPMNSTTSPSASKSPNRIVICYTGKGHDLPWHFELDDSQDGLFAVVPVSNLLGEITRPLPKKCRLGIPLDTRHLQILQRAR